MIAYKPIRSPRTLTRYLAPFFGFARPDGAFPAPESGNGGGS